MPYLKAQYDQLEASIAEQEKFLERELLLKSNTGVTPDQLKEFKEVFEHFDRNKSGTLDRLEFKACLQSLGEDPSDDFLDKKLKELDPNGKGIDFQTFTQFMINVTKDSDSKEEIVASFRSLANDKEFVTEDDLRRVLPGEKVKYLLENMPPYESVTGGYDYRRWAEDAFTR